VAHFVLSAANHVPKNLKSRLTRDLFFCVSVVLFVSDRVRSRLWDSQGYPILAFLAILGLVWHAKHSKNRAMFRTLVDCDGGNWWRNRSCRMGRKGAEWPSVGLGSLACSIGRKFFGSR